jgi:hypothetical protein
VVNEECTRAVEQKVVCRKSNAIHLIWLRIKYGPRRKERAKKATNLHFIFRQNGLFLLISIKKTPQVYKQPNKRQQRIGLQESSLLHKQRKFSL